MLTTLILALAAAPPAATHAVGPLGSVAVSDDPVELADAWPEPEDGPALRRQIARLRKARTDEMAQESLAALEEIGPAAAPLLLTAVAKERNDDTRARLSQALIAVTDARHARLLAVHLDDESESLSAFAHERVAHFREARLVDRAREVYVALLERAHDPEVKERDRPSDEELDRAARTAVSTGALEGLGRCLDLAAERWKTEGARLRHVVATTKGEPATRLLLDRLQSAADDAQRVAALRLLAVAGTQDCTSTVRRYLDADSNFVRVAAINSLRGIVDGDPPLEGLSVFTAIEHAKKWKERT